MDHSSSRSFAGKRHPSEEDAPGCEARSMRCATTLTRGGSEALPPPNRLVSPAHRSGMAQPTARSPLSRRALTVTLVPASSTPLHSRHLKRIHVAAEILKAAKICAGDVLVLRAMDAVDGLEALSLEDKEVRAARRRRSAAGADGVWNRERHRARTPSLRWELPGLRSRSLEQVRRFSTSVESS